MHESPHQPQPRIPGVRYRKTTRHRPETITIDNRPVTRNAPETVWEPQPPRDWDEIVMRAVTGAALAMTLLSLSGTAASIGALLSRTITTEIAYTVAVIVDIAWLASLALEWLDRHDPKRARPARAFGWIALLIAMGAVAGYGITLGQPFAGAVAAAVCLLAKGLWWLVLRHHNVRLSEPTRYWLAQQREELAAQAALATQLRRLDRRADYLHAAFGQQPTPRTDVRTDGPDTPEWPWPDDDQPLPLGPDEDPEDLGPDSPGPGRPGSLHSVGGTPKIAGTVRALLSADPDISDDDLVEHVRDVHGDHRQLPETVARTRRRLQHGAAS